MPDDPVACDQYGDQRRRQHPGPQGDGPRLAGLRAGTGGHLHHVEGQTLASGALKFLRARGDQVVDLAEAALRVLDDLAYRLVIGGDPTRRQHPLGHLPCIVGRQRLERRLHRDRLAHGEAGTPDQQDAEQRTAPIAQSGEQAEVAQGLRQQGLRVVDGQDRRLMPTDGIQCAPEHRLQLVDREFPGIGHAEGMRDHTMQAEWSGNEVADPYDAITEPLAHGGRRGQHDTLAGAGGTGEGSDRRHIPAARVDEGQCRLLGWGEGALGLRGTAGLTSGARLPDGTARPGPVGAVTDTVLLIDVNAHSPP